MFYENIQSLVAKGELSPMYGWHSPKHNKLIPTSVLIYEVEERSAFFITRIHLPSKDKFGGITASLFDNFIKKDNEIAFEFFYQQ